MTLRTAAVPLFALVISASAPARCAANAGPAQSATAAPTMLRMRGVIRKYDAAHRTLSVLTSAGAFEIQVEPAIPIRRGRQDIDAAALEKLTGYRVAVRYSEAAGSRTAESIHVFGKDQDRTRR
jgi:hypothetical protein